jgi:hypothetical protein
MNTFRAILLLIFSYFLLSCESAEPEINQLLGDWALQTTQINVQIKSEAPLASVVDMSATKYLLSLKEDGTYSIAMDDAAKKKIANLDLEMKGVNLDDIKGTYEIKGNIMLFKSNDSDEKYRITFLDTNSFQMEMDRAIYMESLKEQISGQADYFKAYGLTIEEVMKGLSAEIIEYNVKTVYRRP